MTKRAEEVLKLALHLTTEERAELAVELMASVDGEPDADAEAAWDAGIERRARRVLTGESHGIPWEEVRAKIERDILGK